MPRSAKNTPPDVNKEAGLLRAARSAIGVNVDTAAEWVGVYKKTILNWESAKSPNALRLLLYMRELCQRSPVACEYIKLALGMGEGPGEEDPDLERKLSVVRQAHGHESPGIRALFSALEALLSENRQRNTA